MSLDLLVIYVFAGFGALFALAAFAFWCAAGPVDKEGDR